jgi:hypothetical protein
VPRETITILLSPYSPRQVEAQFFSIIAEPFDLRARRNLIEAQYRLLEPQFAHIDSEVATKRDVKLYKRAVKEVEKRMLCTEFFNAYLHDAVVKIIRRDLPMPAGMAGINELRADGKSVGPLTIETLCAWGAAQLSGRPCDPYEDASKNFRQFVWRPAKPVLHMMLCYRWIGETAMAPKAAPLAHAAGFASAAHMAGTAWFTDREGVLKLFLVAEELRHVLLDTARRHAFKQLEETDTIKLAAR